MYYIQNVSKILKYYVVNEGAVIMHKKRMVVLNFSLIIWLLFLCLLHSTAFAAGSYRNDGLATPAPISPKYKTNISSPIPSDDWWTSFVHADHLFSLQI